MKDLHFDYTKAVSSERVAAIRPAAEAAMNVLKSGNGAGNDFLGWLNLPHDIEAQITEAFL